MALSRHRLGEARRALGADPDDLVDFVRVESDFYPGLSEYFEQRAQEWLQRKRRELQDEDEGECDADA